MARSRLRGLLEDLEEEAVARLAYDIEVGGPDLLGGLLARGVQAAAVGVEDHDEAPGEAPSRQGPKVIAHERVAPLEHRVHGGKGALEHDLGERARSHEHAHERERVEGEDHEAPRSEAVGQPAEGGGRRAETGAKPVTSRQGYTPGRGRS